MPKTIIDYSNTIIYKISCKDQVITDVYVGHTTNFIQRKHAHKQGCINVKSTNYKCKLYEVIRNNGGWANWQMNIVNFYNCNNHYEARQKEQEYFVSLNATLNSIEPLPPPKPIKVTSTVATECGSAQMDLEPNNSKYFCKKCNFVTSNKNDFRRHTSTRKHLLSKDLNEVEQKRLTNIKQFTCVTCQKMYPSRNGLWYHKKKCSQIATQSTIDKSVPENTFTSTLGPSGTVHSTLDVNIILELLKQNQEFKELLIAQNKQMMELSKR